MLNRGLAIVTYNRAKVLGEAIEASLKTTNVDKFVICDDGSTDNTADIVKQFKQVIYIKGSNKGVGANKNRALFALQDCAFICILEDDLLPTIPDWFDSYQKMILYTEIHHFCRVQNKEVPGMLPDFDSHLISKSITPIYGESPRGDFTFISNKVIQKVGGFNSKFEGVGYAHGEWSNRVYKAGLINHPNKWVDFKELRDSFIQKGDTTGGRWFENPKEIKEQIKRNRAIQKELKHIDYIYHPLVLS